MKISRKGGISASGSKISDVKLPELDQDVVTIEYLDSVFGGGNFVTLDTEQTIVAPKTFDDSVSFTTKVNMPNLQNIDSEQTILVLDSTGSVGVRELGSILLDSSTSATFAYVAGRLDSPVNISLTGDVTGTVSFDGSGDVSITTTIVDSSHTHTTSDIVSGVFDSARLPTLNYNNDLTGLPQIGSGTITVVAGDALDGGGAFNVNQTGPTTINLHLDSASFAASAFTDTTNAANISTGVLDSARLPPSGGVGNGEITIVAGDALQGGGTFNVNQPSNQTINIHLDSADFAASAFTDTTNADNITSGTVDSARLPSNVSYGNADSAINSTFAIEASRWQTGRTISLTGDATGTSGVFDGTGNASITVTVQDNSHNHIASNITSGVFDSARIPPLAAGDVTSGVFDSARIPPLTTSDIASGEFDSSQIPTLNINTDTTGSIDSARIPALSTSDVTSGVFDSARIPTLTQNDLTGAFVADSAINASYSIEASRLQTGRTISLTGDASGTSGSFDGTGNVSITVTVQDNSHNHTAANITAGILDSARIPALSAADITSGVFDSARIPPTAVGGTVTNVVAGNGMDFTSITDSGEVTLGLPSTLTSSTTNALTATSHTHAIDESGFSLAASQITSGLLDSARIPTLTTDDLIGGLNRFVFKNGLQTESILFVDSENGTNSIEMFMDSDDTIYFNGNSGTLLAISDDLTGTIFSVADISGIPSIEVDASGIIRFAEFDGRVLIGTDSDDSANLLQVAGAASILNKLLAQDSVQFTGLSAMAAEGTVVVIDGTSTLGTRETAASAFTDTTNAANISSGVLDSARLPANVSYGTADSAINASFAIEASRWQTGRTISLTGDASGTSGSFDGTGNASITVTVADNSHNHIASNITSGVFDSARIPNLNINADTTGVLDSARLPVIANANVAAAVTLADTNDASTYPVLAGNPTGDESLGTDTTFNYDASTQTLNVQNLNVNGTTTTINTETLTIDDNIIVLNNNETGTPSQDAGIEIERGTSANKTLLWDEGADRWTVGSETFVAGTFIGDLSGNATSADSATNATTSIEAVRLQTARTISLGGDLSGSQSFDGTSNITITAAVADNSHNHTAANITAGIFDSARIPVLSTADITSGVFDSARIPLQPTTNGTVTSVAAGNGMDFTTITSTGNVTLGTPSTLTASTTNNVTATSHTHQIDETGFVLAASQITSGVFDSARIPTLRVDNDTTGNLPYSRVSGTPTIGDGTITVNAVNGLSGGGSFSVNQVGATSINLNFDSSTNITGTAAAWTTSRTVTFATGDVSGSFSIDGTANVNNVALTVDNVDSAAIPSLDVDADTHGTLPISRTTGDVALGSRTSGNYVQQGATGNGLTGSVNSEGGTFTVTMGTPSTLTASTTNATTASSHTHQIDESGFVLSASQTTSGVFDSARLPANVSYGNADSAVNASFAIEASRWQTGRTISLTGDASGTSGSFDGTGNASITVTVADNSHNHIASNITSGIFDSARIPTLDVDTDTTGQLPYSRVSGTPTIGNATITLTAGNGLITGGDFTTNQTGNETITFTMGTPSTLTASTTNSVTASSHTHQIDETGFVLAASQITSGVFDSARIPALDINTDTTGVLDSDRIPPQGVGQASTLNTDAAFVDGTSQNLSTVSQTAISQYSVSLYRGAKFVIAAIDSDKTHITELLVSNNANSAIATQYGDVYTSTELATYDVDVSGGNVRLLATSASTNTTTYNVHRILMDI